MIAGSTGDMFAVGGAILILDQCSKWLVKAHVKSRYISCGPVLGIRYVTNREDAYKGRHARAAIVFLWLAALASAIILHRSGALFLSHAALVGLGLALGGAAGNLLDILRHRSIVDFLDLRWWPVFNLADVAITTGLALALGQIT